MYAWAEIGPQNCQQNDNGGSLGWTLHSIVSMFTFVAIVFSHSTLGELTFQMPSRLVLLQLLMSNSFGRWPKQVSNSVDSCGSVADPVFSPAYLRHVVPASLQHRLSYTWEGKRPKALMWPQATPKPRPSRHAFNYSWGEHCDLDGFWKVNLLRLATNYKHEHTCSKCNVHPELSLYYCFAGSSVDWITLASLYIVPLCH